MKTPFYKLSRLFAGWIILLGILCCCALWFFVFTNRKLSVQGAFESSVRLWENNFALALLNNDRITVGELSRSLANDNLPFIQVSKDGMVTHFYPEAWDLKDCATPVMVPISRYGLPIGRITGCLSNKHILKESILSGPSLLIVAIMVLLVAGGALRMLSSYRKSLLQVIRVLEEWSKRPEKSLPKSTQLLRNDKIYDRLIALVQAGISNYLEAQRAKEELKAGRALSVMAAQVAHDIRSPLAALDSVMSGLSQAPEEKRIIVRSAIARIHDIANNLIDKHREASASQTSPVVAGQMKEPPSIQLLSSLIDPLITEKRMQFRSRINVGIYARFNSLSYGVFANIQPNELKRALSNLINNAVEAIPERGTVAISIVPHNESVRITVEDDGKGIESEVLSKLGNAGVTHGKEGGSGLGLFHARAAVESWGGKLEVSSIVGKGTTVTITLPKTMPPEWFVSELSFFPNSSVVILDDDTSIHQTWQGRFNSTGLFNKGITAFHFSTAQELSNWVTKSKPPPNVLYLIDYELIGEHATGIDIIESLKIANQSILVTSRYEEKHILQSCQRLHMRLIPKSMAGFVPITVAKPLPRLDCVLIDNDPLVHLYWNSTAAEHNKNIKTFLHPSEFFACAHTLDKSTPLYIDVDLGQGIRGEHIAREGFEMGFHEIYLATGSAPSELNTELPFLCGIRGKTPPWQSNCSPETELKGARVQQRFKIK
ncbi:MAG: HAMP domain-containing histidine kinase [Deltaproteobacteria bacterium]|nr:HAMP domain-containing histidine kinase [Deltaproteobacteria bacterium]